MSHPRRRVRDASGWSRNLWSGEPGMPLNTLPSIGIEKEPMVTLRITNPTRNSVLATYANIANTPNLRRIGLIGAPPPQPGEGLFFPECNAIHTVEMAFPIDVVFVDMLTKRVKKTVQQAQPGCHFNVLVPKELSAAIELPAGTIKETGTVPGDVVMLLSSGHASQADLNYVGAL